MTAPKEPLGVGDFGAAPLDFTLAIYFAGGSFGGHLWPVFTKHPI